MLESKVSVRGLSGFASGEVLNQLWFIYEMSSDSALIKRKDLVRDISMRRLHRKEGMESANRGCKFLFDERRVVQSRGEKDADMKCVERCCITINICIQM